MSCGDCFLVLPPHSAANSIILGRNSKDLKDDSLGVAEEIIYYDAVEALQGDSNGGAKITASEQAPLKIILQKSKLDMWGGDFGANEKNVCMAISYSLEDIEKGNHLCGSDILRHTLAVSYTAADAVENLGALIVAHAHESTKYNFVICDTSDAWSISSSGQLWAAQQHKSGFKSFPCQGLAVTSTIHKSTDALSDLLKTLGHWNGEGQLNFAACFGSDCSETITWTGNESSADGSFDLNNMFETLRSNAEASSGHSASISALNPTGISCHWFTGTPNANESVFKPFVFSPNPKISPLTKATAGQEVTLLHKLHGQRRPESMEKLKNLERTCVEEMQSYFADHEQPDEELDELLKDCVEAEVKFYR